jgi:replicative DNA helicase
MATPDLTVSPPHNLDAEQSVLGAILLSEKPMYGLVIEDGLKPDDFFRDQHRLIFGAILELYNRSESIDPVTVSEQLRQAGTLEEAGGEVGVHALAGAVPAAGHVRQYGRIVRENALLRRLRATALDIQQSVAGREAEPYELVERAERSILEVAHDDRRKDFQSIETVLQTELDKMHDLSVHGTSLTGTPSGYEDLDNITGGFQKGNLIVLAARPSMGKCLAGRSLIYDPRDGSRRRLDDVVAAGERGEDVFVATLDPVTLRLRRARASAFIRSGVQPVFRLRTALGRQIEATANHPLMTVSGWKSLEDLAVGDRVAVPRSLPAIGCGEQMADSEVVLLAALIADGNLTERTPRYCYATGSPVADVVMEAARAMGTRLQTSHGTATISSGRGSKRNPVKELCVRHGQWGKRSAEKFVPDAVFGLEDAQIARFLSVLYACDGHVYTSERLSQIGYTTISERLAHDVQHLLLRLGIVAKIRTLRRPVYDGTEKVAREVVITGQEGLRAFCERVPIVGKTHKLAEVLEGLDEVGVKTNVDTIPGDVWGLIHQVRPHGALAELSAATGRRRNHNWHVGKRGLSRGVLSEIAVAVADPRVEALARSDVWWDTILSVEALGDEETFDLTVPDTHNFVADDVVVHNSALVTNIAENASLKHGAAVALFSLEMSEAELAQRFVASQSGTFGDDLRKGRVKPDKWPKILRATNELAQAPLYIDDSSDIGVLEIRAKARRLHHQRPEGLGLIIIDYLQLMRADDRIENRVQQVGQISRGLKMLARELEVPVIALSQLNRGVEARTDKRPLLSDLRESGSVEQDADLVMFIYRDDYYNREDSEKPGIAEILISKHRNGGLGIVDLVFQSEYPRFMSYKGED